jgi:hypothetical protein
MQLFVLILKKVEIMQELVKSLAATGVRGGTILEGTGMAKSLVYMEDLPIFGMLKALLADEGTASCKVMLFVLKEDQVQTTRETIKKVVGDLNAPNTGIMFSVPINFVEGLSE